MCNGDETKLGSNFVKLKPKVLKIWKTPSLDEWEVQPRTKKDSKPRSNVPFEIKN